MHITYFYYLIGFIIILVYHNESMQNTRITMIYNNKTTFLIGEKSPESKTMMVFTPECVFNGNYTHHDCKTFLKIFLDLECELFQEKNVSNFRLYLSPLFTNYYDARIEMNYDKNKKISHSWLSLAPGLSCQSNNVCIFVMSFIFAYDKWDDVPMTGNNVSLNCNKFIVYSFV